ncbi:MAG TPA: hypothetical protein VFW19_08730 [Allosphingosinicella sp.]|nr:hypothetical protein [Allosphingosinicella sp.]
MTRFGAKLDSLSQTAELILQTDVGPLADALRAGGNRHAIAIGSGGSTITAHYFARCRETLFGKATEVVTPTEFLIANGDLTDVGVWLFSAGADNPDSVASVVAGRAHGAAVNIVTRNAEGAAAMLARASTAATVISVPVADAKDGFLATHSLLASALALLLASDAASEDPIGDELSAMVRGGLAKALSRDTRQAVANQFAALRPDDLLLLIADPQVRAVAELIETSAWEAAICPVQRTDVRNFAHGRHSWLHHRASQTFVIALTSDETRAIWERAAAVLPQVRMVERDFAGGGRLRNALGIVEALVMVGAMGRAVAIDPGKPGIGEFGRALYGDDGLLELARDLDPATRQKRAAILHRDEQPPSPQSVRAISIDRLNRLCAATIGGVVLDYDGTMITEAERFGTPGAEVTDELVRLDRLGVRIGIATGRGGSGGKALRDVLPQDLHYRIVVGYYNGAYLQPLATDIEDAPPPTDPALAETFAWLQGHPDLFKGLFGGRFSNVQISVKLDTLADLTAFPHALKSCPPIASGAVKFARSGHSIDFVAASTSKRRVIEHVRDKIADGEEILCVGDSGARGGNDHELLSHPLGVSVGTVCGRHEGCWSLFGPNVTGPAALLRLLRAVQRDVEGIVRIDVDMLRLDTFAENEYK